MVLVLAFSQAFGLSLLFLLGKACPHSQPYLINSVKTETGNFAPDSDFPQT